MNKDLTLLDIPNFTPLYMDEPYGFPSGTRRRDNLVRVLSEACEGYCMYCYSRITVDKKLYYHLEHGIEKADKTNKKLTDCVMNIAITCSVCNDKFKKVNESDRIEFFKTTEEYKNYLKADCCAPNCREICAELIELRKKVNESEFGHINFQPLTLNYPSNMHYKTNNPLHVQYDILLGKFVPDVLNLKDEDEAVFLQDHINYFHLNDKEYRTDELYRFCRDVVDKKMIDFPKGVYNNYVVDLLIDKLAELDFEDVYKTCRLIYLLGLISGRI